MREAFNIREPRPNSRNFELAFNIVFGAQAAGNLRRLFERALHKIRSEQG